MAENSRHSFSSFKHMNIHADLWDSLGIAIYNDCFRYVHICIYRIFFNSFDPTVIQLWHNLPSNKITWDMTNWTTHGTATLWSLFRSGLPYWHKNWKCCGVLSWNVCVRSDNDSEIIHFQGDLNIYMPQYWWLHQFLQQNTHVPKLSNEATTQM